MPRPVRPRAPSKLISESELRRLYIDENRSDTEIAAMSGRYDKQITALRKQYGIPTRSRSETAQIRWRNMDPALQREYAVRGAVLGREYHEQSAESAAATYRAKPTPTEQVAIGWLRAHGEPFEFQVRFRNYIVDFVLPARRIVIEIDSAHHRSYERIRQIDAAKDQFLADQGYEVRRIALSDRTPMGQRRHIEAELARTLSSLTPKETEGVNYSRAGHAHLPRAPSLPAVSSVGPTLGMSKSPVG